MTGLVFDLQHDALDKNIPAGDLLRKAMVVSRKLDLSDVQDWLNLELNGYAAFNQDKAAEISPYRVVYGELKCFNPYHGWQPVLIESREFSEAIRKRFMFQSIAQLQDLVRKDSGQIIYQFNDNAKSTIMKMMRNDLDPALFLSRQSVVGAIDAVRNRILDWALDLEQRGIIGEGMSFTRAEKVAASSITHQTVTNIGTMNNSQLQQHSSGNQSFVIGDSAKEVSKLVEAVASAVDLFRLDLDKKEELIAEIAILRSQLESPKPKGTVIRTCLMSVKSILEGAAGNILASGVAAQIPQLVAAIPQ